MNIHFAATLLPLHALVQWFSSVNFSHSVMFNALRPHELQHARLPSPLPTIRACSNSCPLSWWSIQSFHPLSSPSLAFSLSQHQGLFPMSQFFTSGGQTISFIFSISPSKEYSGLISFRIEWFDLLAVQVNKSLLQHYSSKASILRHSAFFIVQLSNPYMTTGKNKALTRQTFVGKVTSLLFNMLSRFNDFFFLICCRGSMIIFTIIHLSC